MTVVRAPCDNEHQEIATYLNSVLWETCRKLHHVRIGGVFSDRKEGWDQEYRIADLAVFLCDSKAIHHPTHWEGGPDFAVEIVSPYDLSRDKLPFYAKVGTRELLFVDRDPWQLELFRLADDDLKLTGRSTPADQNILSSEVLPLTFRLVAGEKRPQLDVRHTDGVQSWLI